MAQIEIEKLKTKLSPSALIEGEMKQLQRILPELSPAVLGFLDTQADSPLFPTLSHSVFRVVFDSWEALGELKKGDAELSIKYITSALSSPAWQFGKWAIPLVSDIEHMVSSGKISSNPNLDEALINFEVSIFQFLPDITIKDILTRRLSDFLKRTNLLLEIEKLYSTKQYTSGDSFVKDLLAIFTDNNGLIGTESITVDGKKVPPEIKSWIKDYLVSLPGSLSETNTFYEVQYSRNSPNISKLTQGEKNDLLNVLKIHSWLSDPFVNEEELAAYENESEIITTTQQTSADSQVPTRLPLQRIMTGAPAGNLRDVLYNKTSIADVGLKLGSAELQPSGIKQPPVVPLGPLHPKYDITPQENAEQQKEIDKKLESLKRKAVK